MASDETMTFHSSLQDEDFDDDIIDDGFDHNLQHQHPHNLSRLSVCTSSTLCGVDDEDDVDNAMTMYVSRLSLESSFGDGDDADGELSDGKEEGLLLLSSDSGNEEEDEVGSCYSLPATPPRRRNRVAAIGAKDYASDNEAEKGKQRTERNDERRRRRRNRRLKRAFDRHSWEMMSKKKEEHVGGFSGDSDQSAGTGTGTGTGSGTGVVLITRPKGGKRPLCMGLEEVKACRDLGFELEHERMLEMPSSSSSRLSLEATSSGGNSPIANWRISGPGDDPRDVKARLKVWAQAVALASATKYST